MNKVDSSKTGNQPFGDDELAELEREMETGGSTSTSDTLSSLRREHLDAYAMVDGLAAPVRSAIAAVDAPPRLQDYEELTEIGRGGMGVVYCALHKKTQRQDAIKVIRHDRLAGMSSESVKLMQLRFQQESQLAARVAHEHIVPIYQVGEIDERPWFSMQLVDGASLRELTCDREIAPERIAGYIESIARAIDVVHRHGIIHGDIKPHNILIERETERPLISDFGLANLEGTYSTDSLTGVGGTLAYMAPELASAALDGKRPDEIAAIRSVSSDVYSLGATLWAALWGSSPCWACISSLVFFAKSGNFWSAYRWVGAFWAVAAVLLTMTPCPSILYSVFAALTCVVIAKGDRSFLDE